MLAFNGCTRLELVRNIVMSLVESFTRKASTIVDQSNTRLPPVLLPIVQKKGAAVSPHNGSVFCSNLQERVVELIETAKETIVLSTFLLADECVESAVYEAAKRNIRIYILLACETRLGAEVPDDEFGKMCLTQHKAMLGKLSGIVHFASAPHFHAKAVIVDSLHNIEEAKGLLLTANLTKEALTRNEELAVSLNTMQIEELTKLFRWAIFESAEHHMTKNCEFASYKSPVNIQYPEGLTEILVTSSEENSIRDHALRLIKKADKELIVSSFGWQEDHKIVEAICHRAKAGVKVVVLSRQRPSAMPALLAMERSGATIKCFKWLHAKAVIVDDKRAMVMSANFQTHGMDEGFELGVPLVGEQVSELKRCFETFFATRHKELRTNVKLGMINGDFQAWEGADFKEYSAQESSFIELKQIEARCLSDMNMQPKLPNTNWRSNTSHKIEYRWCVRPPTVSGSKPEHFKQVGNKEKQEQESYKPKVVKQAKRQLAIIVSKESEFELAGKLKQLELPEANIVLEA